MQVGDVEAESVSLRRRVYKGNIDSPKTKRSIRQVVMTNGTIGLLNSWMETLRDHQPSAWLFPSEGLATPLRRDNVWRRSMLPKLRKANLEWATFQVMRRTFATLSKQVGIDPHTRELVEGSRIQIPTGRRTENVVNAVKTTPRILPKLLKRWSGRRGSNPRRPAWEIDIRSCLANSSIFSPSLVSTSLAPPF
jgi:integrase